MPPAAPEFRTGIARTLDIAAIYNPPASLFRNASFDNLHSEVEALGDEASRKGLGRKIQPFAVKIIARC